MKVQFLINSLFIDNFRPLRDVRTKEPYVLSGIVLDIYLIKILAFFLFLYSYFYVLSRLAQEGSLMTIPFMTKRTIRPSVKDLEILLLSSDTEMPPSHDQLVSTNFENI